MPWTSLTSSTPADAAALRSGELKDRLDLDRSYVYDRDRGAIDRVTDLLDNDPGDDSELYALAEQKLATAARDGSGLLARAEENTRAMLTSLLRSLGFTRVEIRFAEL